MSRRIAQLLHFNSTTISCLLAERMHTGRWLALCAVVASLVGAAMSAQEMSDMPGMQMQPTITGKAIPDATARRLYFLSLSNLDDAVLPSYFRFNLGFPPADVAAATTVVRDFRVRYNDAVTIYNNSIGEDGSRFTQALSRDLDENEGIATTDAIESASSTLSQRAMKVLLDDINKSKGKMVVSGSTVVSGSGEVQATSSGTVQATTTSSMSCCYQMTHVDVWNIVSASPPHVILTHTVTMAGHVPNFSAPGIYHQARIQITKPFTNINASGQYVAPSTEINFSATMTADSNYDPCLLDGSLCNGGSDVGGFGGSDTGGIFCTAANGDTFSTSISTEEEAAFTQVYWPGEAAAPATCFTDGSCTYPVAWDCTPATTPPDDPVTDINGGDYRATAPNGVTWRTLAGCLRWVVTGQVFNFTTPWVCSPGLAFFTSFNVRSAPFACTHNQ